MLVWEGRRLPVSELLQTWRETHGKRFLVRTEDSAIFELFYRDETGEWEVKVR